MNMFQVFSEVQPVVLWSDALLFALLILMTGWVWTSRRREATRKAWARVGRSDIAMAAATVLSAFVLLGVLDSLHYRARLDAPPGAPVRYSIEVQSVLDALFVDIRTRNEKTYSAPLATHLFAKEALENSAQREFPRLRYGGSHLGHDVAGHSKDILSTALVGAAGGGVVGIFLWWCLGLWLHRQRMELRTVFSVTYLPPGWRAAGWCLVAMCFLVGLVATLANDYHVLGTDKVGQDVLYLSLKSVRTGLLIGTLTTLVMLPVAAVLGILAGYMGGWVDDVVQYLYTTLSSIPGVLLIAAAVLMMQVVIDTHPQYFQTTAERADARLLALCLILGMTSWTGVARLLRGETLKLRELEFVQAAKAFGVGPFQIMRRHILPNLMHIVLITLVMDFSGLVLAEAVLSYVGVGVDPNTISFGSMINTARMELAREPMVWWSLAAAFSFMFVLVLAANLFADAVRDAFDPRVAE
jgi:peptide/nickel transport system permease protein